MVKSNPSTDCRTCLTDQALIILLNLHKLARSILTRLEVFFLEF